MVLCFFQSADQLKSVLNLGALDFELPTATVEHQHDDCIRLLVNGLVQCDLGRYFLLIECQ